MKSMLLEAEGEVLGLGTGCKCYAAGLRVARGETDSSALHTQKSAEDRPGGAPGGCDLGKELGSFPCLALQSCVPPSWDPGFSGPEIAAALFIWSYIAEVTHQYFSLEEFSKIPEMLWYEVFLLTVNLEAEEEVCDKGMLAKTNGLC